MDTVVIGWNPGEDKGKWDAFRGMMEKIFISIKTDGFKTDRKHIKCVDSKEGVDSLIENCSVLVCPEELGGRTVGTGTFRGWKRKAPGDLKVITILDGSRYGGGKCKGLYDNGFYDALFEEDFTKTSLMSVIKASRTKEEAYSYYGLDGYSWERKKPSVNKKKPEGTDNGENARGNAGNGPVRHDTPVIGVDRGIQGTKDTKPLLGTGNESGRKGNKEKTLEKSPGQKGTVKPGPENAAHGEGGPFGEAFPETVSYGENDSTGKPAAGKALPGRPSVKGATALQSTGDLPLTEKTTAAAPQAGSPAVDNPLPDSPPGESPASGSLPSGSIKDSVQDNSLPAVNPPAGSSWDMDYPPSVDGLSVEGSLGRKAFLENPEAEMALPGKAQEGNTSARKGTIGEFPGGKTPSVKTMEGKAGTGRGNGITGRKKKTGKLPADGKAPDTLDIFRVNEDALLTYIKECEKESHSYVRPFPKLSKTDQMLENLLDYYTVQNNTWIKNVGNNMQIKDEFEADLLQRIAGNDLDLTAGEREKVFNEFSRFMWRYDIIEPYILDPDVSDIKVYDPWTVQVKVRGKKMAAPGIFRSNLHYRGFMGRIARKNHVDITNKGLARFADTRTYTEVRLRGNISTELLNCNGSPLLHIRKVNNTKFTTQQLIDLKMMTPATAAYLIYCIRNGKSLVFCGKGSSGKTTITNWLIDFFPLWLSALCIQEIDELYSVTHPYIQFQQITSDIELIGDKEGKQKYTLRDLAINGLLTDIDAFLIGEIKGPEALQFTNSANTGNQCICTVHSENEREALPQIADYSKFSSDYSRADLLKRLTSIDVVVFMQDFQVKSISEVVGWDEDNQDIVYRFVPIVVPEKISVGDKNRVMGPERRLFIAA